MSGLQACELCELPIEPKLQASSCSAGRKEKIRRISLASCAQIAGKRPSFEDASDISVDLFVFVWVQKTCASGSAKTSLHPLCQANTSFLHCTRAACSVQACVCNGRFSSACIPTNQAVTISEFAENRGAPIYQCRS